MRVQISTDQDFAPSPNAIIPPVLYTVKYLLSLERDDAFIPSPHNQIEKTCYRHLIAHSPFNLSKSFQLSYTSDTATDTIVRIIRFIALIRSTHPSSVSTRIPAAAGLSSILHN